MSEYELSLLRQRGIAARDSKARRGEFRFMLPPGFCWSEAGKIEIDPDEHVAGGDPARVRQVPRAGQRAAGLPVAAVGRHQDARCSAQRRRLQARLEGARLSQRHADPAQPALRGRLRVRPAGAADANRRRASPQDQWASTSPGTEWNVLLRDNHPGYISWRGVRRQSEASARKRPHEEELRAQVRPRWARPADRPDALRTLRPDDARLLRHGERATPIATSAVATTHMWAPGCASASAAFGSIVPSRIRSSRPSPIVPWKRPSSRRTRSSDQPTTGHRRRRT